MEHEIRKQNLQQLRLEYGESFRRALAEQELTPEEFSEQSKIPEEFSEQSKIPLTVVEDHLSGKLRFLGEVNNICFRLNKRLKVELVD